MFIVRRKSRSGGMEYLVKAIAKKGYRWDKVARERVYEFKYLSTARRNSVKHSGLVKTAAI